MILRDKMGEKQRHYKFGVYILREKGRYFVHELEYVNGETKERYVGSLADVVGSYLKMKDNSIRGVGGYIPIIWGRRDLNPGPPAYWWLGFLTPGWHPSPS